MKYNTCSILDYVTARRPIISMGYTDGGVMKDFLDQKQAGVHVSNEEELKAVLMKTYHEFKECRAVQYRGIDAEVMKYRHKEMARKFAEVLESCEVIPGKIGHVRKIRNARLPELIEPE